MQNALNYVKMLVKEGMPKQQAEATVSVIHDMVHKEFATKHDLEKLATRMDHMFEVQTAEINARFKEVDARFKQLEDRMTIKLGGMLTVAVVMIVTLQKIL